MRQILIYDTAGIVLGFILDAIFGDPAGRFHPVCFIGKLIDALKATLLKDEDTDRKKCTMGVILVIAVIAVTGLVTAALSVAAFLIHPVFGLVMGALLSDAVLAAKDLQIESMRVARALEGAKGKVYDATGYGPSADKADAVDEGGEGLSEARDAVGRIVGRDTDRLDREGIIKATVETVAENTSDGVGSPLFYLCIGGPILAFIYKAINTMDSMIGYKNDRYLHFGRVAARLDDIANFIPARISGFLFALSAALTGNDMRSAFKIMKRDGRKSESPNSAICEAACAGALNVSLLGDAYYFGELHHKEAIGDDMRPIETEDIARANRMMRVTSLLWLVLLLAVRGALITFMR